MPLFDHFSLIAPFYDRAIPLQYADKIVSMLGLPVKGALLDVGGGTGRVAEALRSYATQAVIADVSIGMLRQAKSKGCCSAVCAESERMPFPDESFERVLMVDALHHVADQGVTCTQMWRVLCPGGRLVILEPDIHQLAVKGVAVLEKLALMRSHFVSAEHIASLFPYKNACVRIDFESFNAWITVDKAITG